MHDVWARLLITLSLMMFLAVPGIHAVTPTGHADDERERTIAVGIYEQQPNGALQPTNVETIQARIGDRVATITAREAIAAASPRDATAPLLTHPWRLVIYVDPALLTPDSQQRSMDALARHAGQLTALGAVEIVLANPTPITTLPPTRDPQQVVRALHAIGPVRAISHGDDRSPATLGAIRRRFQAAVSTLGGAPTALGAARPALGSVWHTADAAQLEPLFIRLRQATQQEEQLLTERLGRLRAWLLMHPASAPAALIWPTHGWDSDPARFYLAGFAPERAKKRQHGDPSASRGYDTTAMREMLMREIPATHDLSDDLARDIVAAGYVALPLHAASASLTTPSPMASAVANHRPLLLAIAQATGSRIARSFESITAMLDDLRSRQLLTLRLPGDLDQPMPLTLTTDQSHHLIKAPRWIMPRSPENLARGQILTLHSRLGDAPRRSRGCVVARQAVRSFQGVERVAAELSCRINASVPTPREQRPISLQLAVTEGPSDAPRIIHQETIRFQPTGARGGSGAAAPPAEDAQKRVDHTEVGQTGVGRTPRLLTLEAMLTLAPGTEHAGVFVRLEGEDAWLSRIARVVDGEGFTVIPTDTRAFALGPALAEQAPIALVPLDAVAVAGRTPIQVQIFDNAVDRVVYHLEGRSAPPHATTPTDGRPNAPVAVAAQAPFRVWLDLPKVPIPMLLRATALDAAGNRLGADHLALNQRYGKPRLAIREPQDIDAPGPYEVVIDTDADAGSDPVVIDLFWNDRHLVSLTRPPYRAQLDVATIRPGDFLRAIARRGAEHNPTEHAEASEQADTVLVEDVLAEDVLIVGDAVYREEIPVNLVELYTVVEDRRGQPIADLARDSFEAYEDGRLQTLASFADASETPLTVALALDVSDSMRGALPWVKAAARSFVRDVLNPADQALLIAFDQRPSLRLPITQDLNRITAAIDALDLGPGTALHDTVVFGLFQLQAIAGRKALVVLTDGVDQHSNLNQGAMLASARRAGIPIYILRMRDPIPTSTNSTLVPLRRMAKRSGAGLFRVDDAAALVRAYETIARELRSQYLLTYHSNQPVERTGWREVEVRVDRKNLRARSIPGYTFEP